MLTIGSGFRSDRRPRGLQVFRAEYKSPLPKAIKHPPCARYFGVIWFGVAFVWWPVLPKRRTSPNPA